MSVNIGGSLEDVITKYAAKKKLFSENKIINWLIQIGIGLNSIYVKKMLHRNLKPTNVLLDSEDIIKFCDFQVFNQDSFDFANTTIGSYAYLAPEVIEGKYEESSELWAIGCIAYKLCTSKVRILLNIY